MNHRQWCIFQVLSDSVMEVPLSRSEAKRWKQTNMCCRCYTGNAEHCEHWSAAIFWQPGTLLFWSVCLRFLRAQFIWREINSRAQKTSKLHFEKVFLRLLFAKTQRYRHGREVLDHFGQRFHQQVMFATCWRTARHSWGGGGARSHLLRLLTVRFPEMCPCDHEWNKHCVFPVWSMKGWNKCWNAVNRLTQVLVKT